MPRPESTPLQLRAAPAAAVAAAPFKRYLGAVSHALLACSLLSLAAPARAQGLPNPETGRPAGDAATTATLATPSLSLETALKEAVTRSEEAQLLSEKVRHVEARKRQVWSEAFPVVNANVNVGRGNQVMDMGMFGAFGGGGGGADTIPDVFSFTQNRFAYSIDAYQPLFSFGRLTQAVGAANAQERAEAHDRRRSSRQLQMQTLDAYYGLVITRAQFITLEASVKRWRETVAFLESNFKMGAGVRATVLRTITALKALEPQRLNAERDAEAARMHLNRLLGRPLDAPLELDTAAALAMDPIPGALDEQALEEVVNGRPDVRQMAEARLSMERRARYVKMLYLPSLGATGKIGVTAYDTDQIFEFDQNKEWQVGVGLSWNIYDGGSKWAQARQTLSEARQMRLNEQIVRKNARVEIERSFRDYRAADTALMAAEQAVAAAREAQAMLSEDFRAGKGQITDLLETDEALRQAEFGVLAARHQRVRSQAALRLALGKGLINEEAP